MIGLATTGGGVGVVPTFSSEKLVGLNPLAFGVPTKANPPFIFDASMSSVAGNKIELARRLGVDVMPGWVSDKDGVPLMKETKIPEYENPKLIVFPRTSPSFKCRLFETGYTNAALNLLSWMTGGKPSFDSSNSP